MSNLTAGSSPQPFGAGGRKVILPVKATSQIWEGSFVAQIAGACVVGTTASAGNCIGIAEHDMLGGASDGTTRITVLTDRIFVCKAGVAAPTDATPWGTLLFMEDDNSVGTGGLGANEGIAGRFVGFEDDGQVRVFIALVSEGSAGGPNSPTFGTPLTDTATTTIQRVGRYSSYLLAGTMSQGETVTLGTTGAVKGDILRIVRTSTSAQTLTVTNGGAGAGNLCVLVASKSGFAEAFFDGANWLDNGHSAT